MINYIKKFESSTFSKKEGKLLKHLTCKFKDIELAIQR